MKNSFGNNLIITLFGESHGKAIGIVCDGLPAGLEVNYSQIESMLAKRRPDGKLSTKRIEKDNFEIVSGEFNGKTTGTPLCIIIPNENVSSKDYSYGTARPSHADFVASVKYGGFEDYRGGGHFSGRITAPIVALGAILKGALDKKGVKVATHIKNIYGVLDRDFIDIDKDIEYLENIEFATLDQEQGKKMQEQIVLAQEEGDSVGGILETIVTGIDVGYGEPWFDGIENVISKAMFAIPAVKGVEFGLGFSFANLKGSQANDEFSMIDGKVKTLTNNNGGINGGITNGMPILFRTAIKPTPSIFKEQTTVDFIKGETVKHVISGRHDPCIVQRAKVVVDAMTYIALADIMAMKNGVDFLK